MKSARDRRKLPLLIAVGLAIGTATAAAAAFSSTTSNTGNALSVNADLEAPTVARSVVMRSPGTVPGSLKQGLQYRVYAQVTDTGNPASGVASVTADMSAVTTAAGASALTSGSFSAGVLTYNYRSGLLTANNPLAGGTKTYSISSGARAWRSTSLTSRPTMARSTGRVCARRRVWLLPLR